MKRDSHWHNFATSAFNNPSAYFIARLPTCPIHLFACMPCPPTHEPCPSASLSSPPTCVFCPPGYVSYSHIGLFGLPVSLSCPNAHLSCPPICVSFRIPASSFPPFILSFPSSASSVPLSACLVSHPICSIRLPAGPVRLPIFRPVRLTSRPLSVLYRCLSA